MPADETPAARFRREQTGTEVDLPYAGIETFLRGEYRPVDGVGNTDVGVLGVPYDAAASNRPGARYGPRALRRASCWLAYLGGYKGGFTNVRTRETVDYSVIDVVDCGDAPVFPMDHETTAESVRAHAATLAQETFPLLLGGDHSVTLPAFLGVAEARGYDRLGLVQIDAHTDTVEESAVYGREFHGSSTYHIADSSKGSFENVAQVGIRGYEAPDFFEFADDVGLSVFTMGDVRERGIEPVVESAIERASEGADAVYVTFDIDSVDPAGAPGTGTPEPGGLSAREALRAMDVLGAHDAVTAADLVEVAPPFDGECRTALLGASLLAALLEGQFGGSGRS